LSSGDTVSEMFCPVCKAITDSLLSLSWFTTDISVRVFVNIHTLLSSRLVLAALKELMLVFCVATLCGIVKLV
jgi:hypothetical protein